jgi:hypothetical protein
VPAVIVYAEGEQPAPIREFWRPRASCQLSPGRQTHAVPYPQWSYFPRNTRPPRWAVDLVAAVASHQHEIDSGPVPAEDADRLTSDVVLGKLREDMEGIGYTVERGKRAEEKIYRPVLFGDNGEASVTYEIDAFHDELGIAVEVEAGRGAMGNADYRDIVRTSLLLDARFFVLMLPIVYRFGRDSRTEAFVKTRNQLSAIYASDRLKLPFDGVLLIGY